MKILVAGELPDATLEQLRALALEVAYRPDLTAAALRDGVADVGILVVENLRVSPDVIDRAPSLQMIVHAGHGPGDVALEAASSAGIFVTHCPDKSGEAVAEHAFGLLLALDRGVVDHTLALRDGRWQRGDIAARGLAGRTLGIVGWGPVGRLVARRAHAFGMRVVAWSAALNTDGPSEVPVEFCPWPRELARQCDLVIVLSVEGEREPVVDEEFLAGLPEGAYLVHVGRGGPVDEHALVQAIERRGLRVALDAFAAEPAGDTGRFRSRLLELPGVIGTPHVAELTTQARQATAAEVVRVIRGFVVGGEVLNCLNLCERSPATWQLLLRVKDQPGVLAAILDVVRADGINAQEISSRVFLGARASWITIALDERPSSEALDSIRTLASVLHLELRAVV
jgi:D-3-phosphoglycerate dehydrogenase